MLTNINVRGGSLNLKKFLKMVIPGISKLFVIYRLYIKNTKRLPRKFIIDSDRKLVYLNNPKVACSSIKISMFGEQPGIINSRLCEILSNVWFLVLRINAYSIRMISAGIVICLVVCCAYRILVNLYVGFFYFPVVWTNLILQGSTD